MYDSISKNRIKNKNSKIIEGSRQAMKKKAAILVILFFTFLVILFGILGTTYVKASNDIVSQVKNPNDSVSSKLVDMKNSEEKSLEQYKLDYGSDSYGFAAYILHKVQVYSIPFCFVGIAISAIYQYVLGIRKLDTRDKGFTIMIAIVTLFIIAQILPLIFAIVVKGWGV